MGFFRVESSRLSATVALIRRRNYPRAIIFYQLPRVPLESVNVKYNRAAPDYSLESFVAQMPGPYMSPPSTHNAGDQQQHETDYPDFDVPPMHGNDGSAMAGRPFPFTGDSYEHDHHGPHDVIYELPEYGYHHHHHHHPTTTEEPEMNDQRLDKRPYSYYFIGKKLWYVPLYFSIYFIIYIAALVLKSIARHKINFPAQLADVAANSKRSEPDESWRSVAERMLGAAERFAENTSGEGGSY